MMSQRFQSRLHDRDVKVLWANSAEHGCSTIVKHGDSASLSPTALRQHSNHQN
jgi:hypothetical protein